MLTLRARQGSGEPMPNVGWMNTCKGERRAVELVRRGEVDAKLQRGEGRRVHAARQPRDFSSKESQRACVRAALRFHMSAHPVSRVTLHTHTPCSAPQQPPRVRIAHAVHRPAPMTKAPSSAGFQHMRGFREYPLQPASHLAPALLGTKQNRNGFGAWTPRGESY